MKKRTILIILVIVAALTIIYLLLPSYSTITQRFAVTANQATVYRTLTDKELLDQWLADSTDRTYKAGNAVYEMTKGPTDLVKVKMKNDDMELNTYQHIMPLKNDSTVISWTAELPGNNSLFSKISNYLKGRMIKQDMRAFATKFSSFIQQEDKVYGMVIERGGVTDSFLVTTKTEIPSYPQPADYYALLAKLRSYITANAAQETNYPMLNITLLPSGLYEARVAIPVNKELPNSNGMLFKRMIPGKILIAEVQGGNKRIEKAFEQMATFMVEHQLIPPAIPFQSLVTDRLAEPDSTKWITKIYYPVY